MEIDSKHCSAVDRAKMCKGSSAGFIRCSCVLQATYVPISQSWFFSRMAHGLINLSHVPDRGPSLNSAIVDLPMCEPYHLVGRIFGRGYISLLQDT